MKKLLSCILIFMILVGCLSGCGTSDNKLSSADSVFVKPENYAAIVNVSINPSFDIYLDEKAIILGIEPKNEEAKTIDFSDYIGKELTISIDGIVDSVFEKASIERESVALVRFVEGEENISEIDVIYIINNACVDAIAKETVNRSMDSVLQVRLEDEYGCKCVDCNNWYERRWYCYPESRHERDTTSEMLSHYAQIDSWPHKEMNITYNILYGASSDNGYPFNTEEVTPEKYFEKKPEDRELLTGLEKAVNVDVEVYVNGEKQNNYYRGWLYLIEGKWYSNNGVQFSPGG